MSLVKKVWDFLNKDVSKLFKREYKYQFFKREDLGKGTYQSIKIDKKTREKSYHVLLGTREILLPKEAWLNYPDDM